VKEYRGSGKRRGSIYNYLFDDPNFKKWYQNERRGSVATANERWRRFGHLHKKYGKLPADFVALGAEGATDFTANMIDEMENEGVAPNYAANFVKALVAWWDWNSIQLKRRLKIKNRGKNVKFIDEKIPLPDEVQRVLDAGDLRQKVCVVFIAYSGCREEVLGDIEGKNGIRLRDLPEMKIENGKVTFTAIPTRVIVREDLNKSRHQYETFLNDAGCTYLKQYLEWRMGEKSVRVAKSGKRKTIPSEPLTPDSPVVTPTRLSVGKFLRSNQISGIIKQAIRAAGYDWRPYVFKAAFAESMESAERKRTIIQDDRTWWMGHKGNIEMVYTRNNKRLNPGKLAELREGYKTASDLYLTPQRATFVPLEQAGNELKRLYLAEYGKMSDQEIGDLGDLTNHTFPQLTDLVTKRNPPTAQREQQQAKPPQQQQIMIPIRNVNEIKKHLKKGYVLRKENQIIKNQAILELPI
jgi:hypothetical protein